MLLKRVMRSTQLAPMTPSVVSTLPSWLCVFSEVVSRIPGAIVAHAHQRRGREKKKSLARGLSFWGLTRQAGGSGESNARGRSCCYCCCSLVVLLWVCVCIWQNRQLRGLRYSARPRPCGVVLLFDGKGRVLQAPLTSFDRGECSWSRMRLFLQGRIEGRRQNGLTGVL